MARRNRGIILLIVGCLLLMVAGGWYAYNIIEDQNAGQQAAEILNSFEAQNNVNDELGTPVIIVEGDAFCGKVIIEKLSVELPVYDEWSYSRLKTAPCRYTGSIDTNDIIIAAHNYKSHFGSLKTLRAGDEVKFIDAYGKVHLYAVQEIVTLDGTAVSDMHDGGWDFTLFTCTKGGEQRVTVRCIRKNI